jgi:uncharacterized repeat protein (TIGR01451 family)
VISYQIVVSNTGNVILTGLTVTDAQAGGTLTSGATLAIGGKDTFTESHTLVSGDVTAGVGGSYINTAVATDAQGNNSSSTVSTPVTGANPALTIAKTRTSLADTNGDGLTGDAGDVISYQIVVSNTGNVTLTGLTVTDLQAGGTLTSGATLAIGGKDTFTESHTLVSGDVTAGVGSNYINTAVATDAQGNNSSSTVSTPVTGANPSLIVEKLISVDGGINWFFTNDDSDDTISNVSAASGISASNLHIGTPTALSGDLVEVKVVVTNTGNVNDTNVRVTDASPSDTALNNITFTFAGSTSIASLSPGTGNSKLSDAVTFTPTTTVSRTDTDTATATATGAGQSLTDTDSASFDVSAPPIVITGTPQFNFPNSVDSIQPKVGGGASFTLNPGGFIYWDLFSPDISKAQVSTKLGSFSTDYTTANGFPTNLTISIVQVWSSNNSTTSGAAIYRVYVANNSASASVSLTNSTKIASYSIVDGTGAPALSTNKGLIDLVNSDPLIGNFNNFNNIENALTKPPNNDGFSFPTTATGSQTQVWLSPDTTGVATGEPGVTFTDTNTTSNVLIYGRNNTTGVTSTSGDTLSADGHNNLIDGRGGNDSISAGGGNSYLAGSGFGNNTIIGSTGNDTLLGSYGSNTLTGGNGNDVFILQRGEIDKITDFSNSPGNTDQLWIDTFVNGAGAGTANAVATGVTNPTGGVGAGNTTGTVLQGTAATVFNGSLANAPTGAQIIYDNTNGDLYFDPIAGQSNAQIQTNAQLLAILQNEPTNFTLSPSQVYYDPPMDSLSQLVQAVAGTPLGANAAATSQPIVNTGETPWNHHQLAASTG